MHRLLSPRAHGVIDYALVLFVALSPTLFGFADDHAAAMTAYIIAAAHLGLSIMTRYPLGIFRIIPFPTHGGIELAAGVALLVLPWIVGFRDDVAARNVFVLSGLSIFVVYAVTNYRSTDLGTTHRAYPSTR